MTTTRPTRAQLTLISLTECDAIRLAETDRAAALVARTEPGIAPYDPAFLMAAFHNIPAEAWRLLAAMSEGQRINQAIETALYLEQTGIDVRWADVLNSWEKRLRAKGLLGGSAAGVGVVPPPPSSPTPAAAQAETEAWRCTQCGVANVLLAEYDFPTLCMDCAEVRRSEPTLVVLGDAAQLVAAATVPAEGFDEPRWELPPSGDGVERLTEAESPRGVIVSHEELLRRLRLRAAAIDGFEWPVVA